MFSIKPRCAENKIFVQELQKYGPHQDICLHRKLPRGQEESVSVLVPIFVKPSPQNVIGGEVNPFHPLLHDNPGEIAGTVDMDLKGKHGFMLCFLNGGWAEELMIMFT